MENLTAVVTGGTRGIGLAIAESLVKREASLAITYIGRIVNISSIAARGGGVVGPHYAASKAGMLGLTRYAAKELGLNVSEFLLIQMREL